ncbi:unnamed protein product [Amoebophrya sp. A25]|nr:unnamed protein product [Amoebophrya sp. A25]|eukprot:GSA25T00009891001.1
MEFSETLGAAFLREEPHFRCLVELSRERDGNRENLSSFVFGDIADALPFQMTYRLDRY